MDRPEVIALLGPRQAGKTTLLKKLIEGIENSGKSVRFITFENFNDRKLFEDNIESFKAYISGDDVVAIDEFQYAKEGGQKLKYLYDTTDTKFIITGSSSLELTFNTGAYMIGRMVTFMLWPFSFSEFLYANDPGLAAIGGDVDNINSASVGKLTPYFEEYCVWGGYPAVVLTDSPETKTKLLESIYNNYLLRDIKDLLELASDEELLTLMRFLAVQIGNIVNYQELSNKSSLYYKALKEHLNILKETYILDVTTAFATNKRVELTKSPKVFFEDLGFRNTTIQDMRSLPVRADLGSVVENFVYIHLKHMRSELEPVKYWRTKSGAEVDFVLRLTSENIPIEVKYTDSDSIGKSLMSFIKKYQPSKAIVFTKSLSTERTVEGCTVSFVPVMFCETTLQDIGKT